MYKICCTSGLRLVKLIFFRVLYILTNEFLFLLGCIHVLQAREWFGSTAITKTGPNDARRIVWALGIFLFSFFRVLYILTSGFLFYLGCIYVLKAQEGFDRRRSRKRAQTTPDTSFGPRYYVFDFNFFWYHSLY